MEKINLASITEIIVYLGTPALVFSALAGKALVAEDIVLLFVGSTLIFAALGLLIGVYFVLSGFHSRGFALPILFMNAGNMGIPLALFAFGPAAMQRATLLYVHSLQWGHALGGALLRIVGGFAAASAAVLVIGTHGINRQVLLLYGALPAAVVNFILTEKYRQDPALAASVVISTFLSLFTIPVVLWLIL